MSRLSLMLCGCLLLVQGSCGSSRSTPGTDGSAQGDGTPTDGLMPPDGKITDRCIVAIRVGECCDEAVPASVLEVLADPCLLQWPDSTRPPSCRASDPSQCPAVKCAAPAPVSRITEFGRGGKCKWANECSSARDCALAVDERICCACPDAYPSVLVTDDPCIRRPDDTRPSKCSNPCADKVACGPCPPPPDARSLTCVGAGPQLLADVKGCWAGTPPP